MQLNEQSAIISFNPSVSEQHKTAVTTDELKELLKSKGLKTSHHRLSVLQYLNKHKTHPTADEIYRGLSETCPTLSLATVYNTLKAFVEADLIHVLEFHEGEKRYDIDLYEHGHFRCNLCRRIFNVEIPQEFTPGNDLQEFKVMERAVLFQGICPACLKESAAHSDV